MVWDGFAEQEAVGFRMTDGLRCPTEHHGELSGCDPARWIKIVSK